MVNRNTPFFLMRTYADAANDTIIASSPKSNKTHANKWRVARPLLELARSVVHSVGLARGLIPESWKKLEFDTRHVLYDIGIDSMRISGLRKRSENR